jgi:hypothetical protein
MADIFSWLCYINVQGKRRDVTCVLNEVVFLRDDRLSRSRMYSTFCRLLDIVVYKMCTKRNILPTL